jgi:hypothetical protein
LRRQHQRVCWRGESHRLQSQSANGHLLMNLIVDPDSAKLDVFPSQSIAATHTEMIKFELERGAGFISAAGQLLESLEAVKAIQSQAGPNHQNSLEGQPGSRQHTREGAGQHGRAMSQYGNAVSDQAETSAGPPFQGQRQLTNDDSSVHESWDQQNHVNGTTSSNSGSIYQGNGAVHHGQIPSEGPSVTPYQSYPFGWRRQTGCSFLQHTFHASYNRDWVQGKRQ